MSSNHKKKRQQDPQDPVPKGAAIPSYDWEEHARSLVARIAALEKTIKELPSGILDRHYAAEQARKRESERDVTDSTLFPLRCNRCGIHVNRSRFERAGLKPPSHGRECPACSRGIFLPTSDVGTLAFTPKIDWVSLHHRVICVAQTRVEGAWRAFVSPVQGSVEYQLNHVIATGAPLQNEEAARALFPPWSVLPYAL